MKLMFFFRSRVQILILLSLGLLLIMVGWRFRPASPAAVPAPASPSSQAVSYGQVPLSFEANHGQAKDPVQYLARGTNATLYLTPTEAALEVKGLPIAECGLQREESDPASRAAQSAFRNSQSAIVKMKLVGANAAPVLRGEQELPGKSNYFSGKDQSQWQTNIPTYARVKYEQVYAGIDLVYYGNQQQLEYDFIVQPGADPNAIRFRLEGGEAMALNAAGELVVQTAAGEVKQQKPVLYQEVNSSRREVTGNYVLQDGEVGFEIGAYDPSLPLVIDPVIVYATYIGTGGGSVVAMTADAQGQLYLAMNFGPEATAGSYQNGNGLSVFKLNQAGSAILYSATFGGSTLDRAFGIAVDAAGNCYVTGQAASSTFPTTPGAFQTDPGLTCGACYNAFVTKLSPTGDQLVYSTFLTGNQPTQGVNGKLTQARAIAVDTAGNAYVTGHTNVKDFPTTPGAFQSNLNIDREPAQDSFITKVNPTGTGLVYSTYLGAGDNLDQGKNIAVDAAGNVYVTGGTGNGYGGLADRVQKTPFPKTPGVYERPSADVRGGMFLTKFNSSGTTLLYSTIIGLGEYAEDSIALAVDSRGSAYLASWTVSPNYPVTPGAYKTTFTAPSGYGHAFITKVNPTGSALIYSTFVGGSSSDVAIALGIDGEGNATIVGQANSPDFPQTAPPIPFIRGNGFVTKLNPTADQILYSQLLSWTAPRKATFDGAGNVYIQGDEKDTFQVTPGAYQSVRGSTTLTKISLPKSAVTVSAANYSSSPLASEAIVSAFGTGLATSTQSATSLPLPKALGGTTIKVRDSGGTERDASLFFVSPTQLNFQIPPGTANGNATITITAQDGTTFLSNVEIANVVPSLFSADATGRGLAAAHLQRAGSVTFEQVVKFDFSKGQWVALPIDLGAASEQVYLILYGTGIRLRSSLNNVTATIGGTPATVTYAGAQNDFVGLDQVNVLIPRSLIGRGMADVVLNVEGKTANTLKVSIK